MRQFVLLLAFSLVVLTGPVIEAAAEGNPLGLPSQAGGGPTLSSLDLALWPEYDRPEVLVIYRGAFAPETALPVAVEIRIPARVGAPTAVAYAGQGGERLNQEYTTRTEGDQLVVSFELTTLEFQLEYYDALGIDSTGKRSYSFSYTADYPITALSLQVQSPPTAEALTLDPPADSTGVQDDGLTYQSVQAGAVAQGAVKSWTLTYQKADSALTVETMASAAPAAPTAAAAPEGANPSETGSSTVLVFLVAFVALIAVGAAAFWLGRRTQPLSEPSVPPTGHRPGGGTPQARLQTSTPRAQPVAPRAVSREEVLYCNKCGAILRPDSDFCHKCGAPAQKREPGA
jgi:hypothetical protein